MCCSLVQFVFRSLDNSHSRNTTFFRRLFAFLW
jgi:hypothetical protein